MFSLCQAVAASGAVAMAAGGEGGEEELAVEVAEEKAAAVEGAVAAGEEVGEGEAVAAAEVVE